MGCTSSSQVVDNEQTIGYANAIYYPDWKIYSGKVPSTLDLKFVSHVFYAFALVREDGTIYLSDEYADLQYPLDDGETSGCLNAFIKGKHQNDGLKLILSVGGANGSQYFASVASDPEKTARFVSSAQDLAAAHELDGFDVDWEHPKDQREGELYANLLAKMREAFPAGRYTLTTALSAGTWVLRNIKLSKVARTLDFINLMAYDFSGPWCPASGHQAQLFTPPNPHDENASLSCQSALQYMHSVGVPLKKILLGVPVYGRAFPGTNGIGQKPAEGVEHQEIDYCDLPPPDCEEHEDDSVGAGYCVDESGAGFISYDTPRVVQQKARYARTRDLGGLFYWHAAADGSGPRCLVTTGYLALWNRR